MEPITAADSIHQVHENVDGDVSVVDENICSCDVQCDMDNINDSCDENACDEDSVKLLDSTDTISIASKRCITIEPVLLLASFYISSMFTLTDQCIRARIADSLNYTHSTVDSDNCTVVNVSSSSYILEKHIQSETSLWLIYLSSCALIPAFVSTLILGSYSDKVGRKIAILLPTAGAIVRVTLYIFVLWFGWPLPYLLIGYFIDGLSGSVATVLAASFAYLADVTSLEQRSLRIVILEGCIAFGFLIAQVALGFLIANLGYIYPFVILLGVNILIFLYTVFILPESLIRQQQHIKLCSLHHFTKPVKLLFRDISGTGRRWKLQLIFCIHVIASMVTLTDGDIQVLYMLDFPFCWDSVRIGLFAGIGLLSSVPVSIILTILLQKRITDLGLMMLAILSAIIFEVLMAAAFNTTMLFIVILMSAPRSLITAMVRSISSKLVDHDEEGALFAGISWLQLLAVFIGGGLFQVIYSQTVLIFRGIVFLVMAGVYCVAAALILVFAALLYAERKKAIQSTSATTVES